MAKLSLLSCISATGDYQLQQMGLQMHLAWEMHTYKFRGRIMIFCLKLTLRFHHSLWLVLFMYCLKLMANEHSHCRDHLDMLSIQCKVRHTLCLETHFGTWNRFMLGFHPPFVIALDPPQLTS